MKYALEGFIFPCQSSWSEHAAVGVDVKRDTRAVEAIDGVFLHAPDRRNDLNVGRRAEFQVNPLAAQMFHQFRILDAARSVANSLRLEHAKRLPHALRPKPFAGVSRAKQAMFSCVAIRSHMSVQRESCFISGKIERHDPAALKLFHEPRGEHALRLREMSQRAEDQPGLHPGFPDQSIDGSLHYSNDALGS